MYFHTSPAHWPLTPIKQYCLHMGDEMYAEKDDGEKTVVLLLSARTCSHLVVVLGEAWNKYPYPLRQLPPLSVPLRVR